MIYYDRYKNFKINEKVYSIPFLEIPTTETDILITFDKKIMRMDKLSDTYYGTPLLGFLILQANKITTMEFDIEHGKQLRIPYPLENAVTLYNNAILEHIRLNGLE